MAYKAQKEQKNAVVDTIVGEGDRKSGGNVHKVN